MMFLSLHLYPAILRQHYNRPNIYGKNICCWYILYKVKNNL